MDILQVASPIQIAALWRLEMLTGADVSRICLRLLEEDLDAGDPNVASFAGRCDLTLSESGRGFEQALERLAPGVLSKHDALLRALHLHLDVALRADDLMEHVGRLISRFAHLSETRLVVHPRRANDRPAETFAAEDLGLEYIYGSYDAFDDISAVPPPKRALLFERQMRSLRSDVTELRDHLAERISPPCQPRG